ncbi:MAG: hypothetical protein QOD09_1706 [Bradyrhizobium sp.]|jgi:hypothetical protein|nr:hypothetical protein [Bradyrhizobium sp.]
MAKDAFDQFWEWANKPLDSGLGICGDIHGAVIGLDPEDRNDRKEVNRAVRHALDPNIETIWLYMHGEQLETSNTKAEGEAWLEQNDPRLPGQWVFPGKG